MFGSNIPYRAYVPYDDPSGRDLLIHIFGLSAVAGFSSYSTIVFAIYVVPILVTRYIGGHIQNGVA